MLAQTESLFPEFQIAPFLLSLCRRIVDTLVPQRLSKIFQKRINDLISESDLSFSELAVISKISHSSLSQAKTYGIIPKPSTLIKNADYFNCSIEFLLGETNNAEIVRRVNPVPFLVRFQTLLEKSNLTFYAFSKLIHIESNSLSTWRAKNYIPSLEKLLFYQYPFY